MARVKRHELFDPFADAVSGAVRSKRAGIFVAFEESAEHIVSNAAAILFIAGYLMSAMMIDLWLEKNR